MWEESERGARFVAKLAGVFLVGMVLILGLIGGVEVATATFAAMVVLVAVACALWLVAGSLLLGAFAALSWLFRRPSPRNTDGVS